MASAYAGATFTSSTGTELIYPAIIEAAVKAELGAATIMLPLVKFHNLGGEASRAWDVPLFPNIDAQAAAVAEADLVALYAINPTKVTVTAGEYGVATAIGDRLLGSSVLQGGLILETAQYLARAVARKFDSVTTALFSSASWTTTRGTTNTDLDTIDILGAIADLEAQNAGGPLACVLPPVGAHDLRQAIAITYAAAGTQTSNALAPVNANFSPTAIGAMNGQTAGAWANIYNVPMFISSTCPVSGNDSIGCMFTVNAAIGAAAKYLGRIEYERSALDRTSIIVCVSDFGVNAIELSQGVKILVQTAR